MSLVVISDQKIQYALFQRDLLALVVRWNGLVRATALLPVSGYTAPTACREGQGQLAEVRQQVDQMEQTLKQTNWIDKEVQEDLQKLFAGIVGGLKELERPYADLQAFIDYHNANNDTLVNRSTMADLVQRTWKTDASFDRDRLFLIVRLYNNIARLDSNFTRLIDTKATQIRARFDRLVDDRYRWYGIGQASLGLALVLLVILLMRRLSELYRESIASKEAMADLSKRDPLTDLPNRRTLVDLFALLTERTKQFGLSFCLMLLDVDNFKGINDTLGHAAGDLLLKTLAERMTGLVRKPAVVARLGGDEFVLLLPDTSQLSDAETIARRLLAKVAEPLSFDGRSVRFSISIGIAQCPFDGESLEALLHSADLAMYEAKERGKNTFAVYARNLEPM